jgi:two-component system response regulator DesR
MQKILLIDDHNMIIEQLMPVLSNDYTVNVAQTAEQMRAYLTSQKYDLALMDCELRDGSSAVELLITLNQADIPVVIISGTARDELLRVCINLDARGFIDKHDGGVQKVVEAVRIALAGNTVFPRGLLARLGNRDGDEIPKLSNREIDILDRLCQTPMPTNQEIADVLGLAHGTIRNAVATLAEKFAVKGRDKLVFEAQRRGFRPDHYPQIKH